MNGPEIDTGPVHAVQSRCGCAGKTPLNRVVRPALTALRDRLEGVRIAGDLEAGLLPNTTVLKRSVVGTEGDATDVGMRPPRVVAAAFVDGDRGGGVMRPRFTTYYRMHTGRGPAAGRT